MNNQSLTSIRESYASKICQSKVKIVGSSMNFYTASADS